MLVAAKFVIEGPSLIDTSRRGGISVGPGARPTSDQHATTYFFITELVFVAFAMALFFTYQLKL